VDVGQMQNSGLFTKTDATELLRQEDFVYTFQDGNTMELDISVVYTGTDAGQEGKVVMAGSPQTVAAKWQEILYAAASYGYAEQGGIVAPGSPPPPFTGPCRNLPDSMYCMPKIPRLVGSDPQFNNSNTYVRWLMNEVSLSMPRFDVGLPGSDLPVSMRPSDDSWTDDIVREMAEIEDALRSGWVPFTP
jgi:hypothetical protein